MTRHAAAGVMRRDDGKMFVQQRRAPQTFAGYWEFPGGKVQPGENALCAMSRELREEAGIHVLRARHFVQRRLGVGKNELLLDVFIVMEYEGAPHGCEKQSWRWAEEMPQPMLAANREICKWLRLPSMYAITAAEVFGVDDTLRRLAEKLATGEIKMLQLRDKNLPTSQRADFARQAAALCRQYGALLLINDDEALAAEVGADGVHLSSRRLAECSARPNFEWAAASCHSPVEATAAAALGFDFIVLSPVCKTLSHVDAAPLGWKKFGEAALACGIPVYALGGLGEEDLPVAYDNNACGVAFMRRPWE